jgi:hypothetical protein
MEQIPTPSAFNQALPFGVLILQSAGGLNVGEGGATDSYQLALQSIPAANVQIMVDPDAQTDLGAGAGVAVVLTFTPADALIPQTVNVTAVDDIVVEGNHTSSITHTLSSADTRYNGLAVPNVIASIMDNDAPAPTSIVISELMYDPASDETVPGVGEWIEVVNTGTAATDLSGWLFDDEDATNWGAIPSGTVLNPSQVAVFFDSAFTTAATFRSEWTVPVNSLVVGVTWGSLGNNPAGAGDEVLTLLNNVGVQVDVVNYDNASPWPSDLEGHSIYLKNLSADNNAGANWARSVAGAPKVASPTGPTFSTSDIGSPGRFFLPADYNANASVDAGDYVVWRKTLGSTTNLQADGSGPTIGVPNGVVDQADYNYWLSNFGGVGASSGAGAGAGEMLVASSVSKPPAAALSQTVEPAAAANELVVDAAMVDLSPAIPSSATTPRSLLRSAPSSAAASAADSLLTIIRPVAETVSLGDSTPAWHDSVDRGEAVDQLFASFDESDLVTDVGLLSLLV